MLGVEEAPRRVSPVDAAEPERAAIKVLVAQNA